MKRYLSCVSFLPRLLQIRKNIKNNRRNTGKPRDTPSFQQNTFKRMYGGRRKNEGEKIEQKQELR